MKFYEVTAKCGHVGGTHKYIPIDFYTHAKNAAEAAAKVRKIPRVKHHQKDAILSVREISYEEYVIGSAEMSNDPFLFCKSKQEQSAYNAEIDARVCDEVGGRYTPWRDEYKYSEKATESKHNRKKLQRYGYKNNYLLETQGSFNYKDYMIEDCYDEFVA